MKLLAFIGIFGLLAAGTSAVPEWSDLRITSGTDLTTSFLPLPRTAQQAFSKSWIPEGSLDKDCETGRFKGVRYIERNDSSIALLFDKNGVIAGIQAQIPHSDIIKPENTFRFERVPMFQNLTIEGKEFFVLTAYFVNPSTLCSNPRTEDDLLYGNGTGTGLWYQNGPTSDDVIEVPHDRAEGWAKGWSQNKCWRAMGNHNFWQTEKYDSHHCNEIRPVFNLFDKDTDRLLGFGFTIPGATSQPRFERPPNAVISAIVNPTPACLTEMNDRVGAATLHIYFVPEPWMIGC